MKTLKKKLGEGFKNCYLFSGEDYELYTRGLSMILKRCELAFPDFNFAKFDDENFSMKGIVDSCEVLPMGDKYRVILVKNVQKISENDKKLLQEYLNKPCQTTILIVFDFYSKWTFLKEYAEFVDCKRFDTQTAISVVANEFSKRGKKISDEGAKTLLEYCNGYLTRVMSEVDKIAYYEIDEPLVTKKNVDELVVKDSEVVVYELTEALGSKNGDKALKALEALKKEPGILGLITNHFRRLFFISTSGLNDKELSNLLGVKEYAITKQRNQIKNFSKMQLKKIYALLEEIDFSIKSGAFLQENALNYLVLSILYI